MRGVLQPGTLTVRTGPGVIGFGDLEIWRFGDLEIWRFGDLEFWSFGVLEFWGEVGGKSGAGAADLVLRSIRGGGSNRGVGYKKMKKSFNRR
jgi:hypothetical protein